MENLTEQHLQFLHSQAPSDRLLQPLWDHLLSNHLPLITSPFFPVLLAFSSYFNIPPTVVPQEAPSVYAVLVAGCPATVWHSVLHLARGAPQAPAALPVGARYPSRVHIPLLLVRRAAQHPGADGGGVLGKPGPRSPGMSPADNVVRDRVQHLDVGGGPHRVRPAVDAEPGGALWAARRSAST